MLIQEGTTVWGALSAGSYVDRRCSPLALAAGARMMTAVGAGCTGMGQVRANTCRGLTWPWSCPPAVLSAQSSSRVAVTTRWSMCCTTACSIGLLASVMTASQGPSWARAPCSSSPDAQHLTCAVPQAASHLTRASRTGMQESQTRRRLPSSMRAHTSRSSSVSGMSDPAWSCCPASGSFSAMVR